jgi:hypothetical protein
MMSVLETKIDGISDDVKEVKELAKATNGRVRDIELWKAKMEGSLGVGTKFIWPVASALIVSIVGFVLLNTFFGPQIVEVPKPEAPKVGQVHRHPKPHHHIRIVVPPKHSGSPIGSLPVSTPIIAHVGPNKSHAPSQPSPSPTHHHHQSSPVHHHPQPQPAPVSTSPEPASPPRKVGQTVEHTGNATGQTVEHAGNAVGQTVEGAGKAVGQTVEHTGQAVGHTTEGAANGVATELP